MGDVVNLRRFRKRKAREDAAARAGENRASHGEGGALRKLRKAEDTKARRLLDGHRRDRPDDGPESAG